MKIGGAVARQRRSARYRLDIFINPAVYCGDAKFCSGSFLIESLSQYTNGKRPLLVKLAAQAAKSGVRNGFANGTGWMDGIFLSAAENSKFHQKSAS